MLRIVIYTAIIGIETVLADGLGNLQLRPFAPGGKNGVSDCSQGSAVVKWKNFTQDPDPPQRGQQLSIHGTGITAKSIKSGEGSLTATLNGMQIFQAGVHTCGETDITFPGGMGQATFKSFDCPTRGHLANSSFTMRVPDAAPSGHYDVRIVANDQHGKLAYCIDASFDL